jgi:hypothetical protein
MLELIAALAGLTLLLVIFIGERWRVGIGGLLLGIAALAALGLVVWFSWPVKSRAILGVFDTLIESVTGAPETAMLTLLGFGLVGVVFARRGCPS